MDALHQDFVPVSRLRRFLGFYLNVIIGGSIMGAALHFIDVPADKKPLIQWALAFLFAALDELLLGKSPGHFILSITPDGVGRAVYERETYLSMFAAVILILDGCKRVVLWTQYQIPEPVMGRMAEGDQLGAYNIALGTILIAAGTLIMRVDRLGWLLGLFALGVHSLSVLLSWSMWNDYVPQMVARRREMQGIPVREGEIGFMQAAILEAFVVGLIIGAVVLFITYRQVFRAREV